MERKLRLKPHVSKFMTVLRIVDAALVPLLFFGFMKLSHVRIGERALLLAIVAMLLTAVSMESVGLYRRWRGALIRREVHTVLAGWALVMGGVFLAGLGSGALKPLPTNAFIAWIIVCPAAISCAHAAGRWFLRSARRHGYNQRRAVIAGAGIVGSALVKKFESIPWAGIEVVSFFDDDPQKQGIVVQEVPVRGPLDRLADFVRENDVDMVYITLPMRAEGRMVDVMDAINGTKAAVYMVPDIFVFDLLGSKILDVDGIPVVSLSESPQIGPAGIIKRLEDLTFASLGLLALAPVFALIALMIKRASPGPVFFGHTRIGQNGRKFKCYKFRTMVTNADQVLKELLDNDLEARKEWEANYKLKNDPRITGIGNFLRKTSLDELPQLFNVIRGEMSLVGPRPIIDDEVRKYGRYYRHLALVRPGMTGLWQVSGRNDVTYHERVQMDVEYARQWSVWSDIVILFKTVKTVVARSGSY